MKLLQFGKMATAVFLFLIFLSFQAFGQFDKNLVLNHDLEDATRNAIEQRGQKAAETFINALLSNDMPTANAFFPSKEIYKNMIIGFGFKTEAGQKAALENHAQYYDSEKQRVHTNFAETASVLAAKGELEIVSVHFTMKENVALPGGRAAVVLKQRSTGNTFTVYFYKFYEHAGNWYIINKVHTDS